jgi:hypothetical protein
MVHALFEAWRVLRVAGRLVDLRPAALNWSVEVVTPAGATTAGQLDYSPFLPTEAAANAAIAEIIETGRFEPESEVLFQYNYYWDSVDGMADYIAEKWSDSAILPDSVRTEAGRLRQRSPVPVQLRVIRTMHLASYRKPPPGS